MGIMTNYDDLYKVSLDQAIRAAALQAAATIMGASKTEYDPAPRMAPVVVALARTLEGYIRDGE